MGHDLNEERIMQAAFFNPASGTIIPTGAFHDIEQVMAQGYSEHNAAQLEQGFVTDRGRFLNRLDAAKLVKGKATSMDSEEFTGMGHGSASKADSWAGRPKYSTELPDK